MTATVTAPTAPTAPTAVPAPASPGAPAPAPAPAPARRQPPVDPTSPALEALAELAGSQAEEADRTGRLGDDVVAAVRAAGFTSHFVPRSAGGAAGTFGDLAEAVVRIGEQCAATAWCASLAAAGSRFAGYLPAEGQRELWADGPDVLVATALVPSGTAAEVPGGFTVEGEFGFVSAAAHADVLLLCGPSPAGGPGGPGGPDAPGGPDVETRFFAVPASAVTVVPTWDTVGMRATGTDTVVLPQTFVPTRMSVPRAVVMRGRSPHSDARCHQVPFPAAGGLTFAPTVVGAARAALSAVTAATATGRRQPGADLALARAAARVDAAELLVERAARVLDGGAPTPAAMARNGRDTAAAAEIARDAVEGLVHAVGTRGLSGTGPLTRAWRDVTVAASHVALRPETGASGWVDATLAG